MGAPGGGGSGSREQALGRNQVVRGNLREKVSTEQRLEGGVGSVHTPTPMPILTSTSTSTSVSVSRQDSKDEQVQSPRGRTEAPGV